MGKKQELKQFLASYKDAVQHYVDFLWENEFSYKDKNDNVIVFNISKNLLNAPKYFDYKATTFPTELSARALNEAASQSLGIVKAAIKKHSKRLFKLNQLKLQHKNCSKLIKKIESTRLVKPSLPENFNAELSSKNAVLVDKKTKNFDGFIKLQSLGKYKTFYIPFNYHRHSNKLKARSDKLLGSFLISQDYINLRWNIKEPEIKTKGLVVGADQGFKDILTLSNGTVTQKQDLHGHSLESIIRKLSHKKKDSKAFKKAQDHRKNFINWSLNQLNLNNIKQINLEKVVNIRFKKRSSRLMSHWTNTLIRDKLIRICEDRGVRLELQSSIYYSQRCYQCGWVCKSNRKSKEFKCKCCGHLIDADLNAAQNHSISLPDIPFELRILNQNRQGFFWNVDGIFGLTKRSLESLFLRKVDL